MEFQALEKGSGRPVIMLHGMFAGAQNWNGIMGLLSARYRTIALHMPYLDLDKENCTVEYLSRYVLGFADSKGIDKAVYIGNSLGGHVAIDIAIRAKERVEALVLTGSSGLFERSYEEDLEIHPTRPYVKKKVSEIFFNKTLVTDKLVDDVYGTVTDKKNRLKVIRLIKSAKSYNVKDLLSLIECPTLLIWGREDSITPPEVALEFNKHIKKSELKFMDNCCHAPMMEYPDRFGSMVVDFLSGIEEKYGA